MAASRLENLDYIGPVKVTKKTGLKRINMRLHHSGEVRVSIPYYLPFSAGFIFAKSHSSWINQQKSRSNALKLYSGMKIGKKHTLIIRPGTSISTRISEDHLVARIPNDITVTDADFVRLTKQAIKRTLSAEAKIILPERVEELASQYKYTFSGVHTKPMKARWGSCSSNKLITLNIYLLMMPWPVIDYVIMHELAHTVYMNHSSKFWAEVARTTPNYKEIKKIIKLSQADIHALYL